MVRGLYTAASGMNVQQNRLDEIANNLANVDLNGYKKDTAIQKAFPEMLMRRMNDNGVYVFPVGSVDTTPIVGTVGTGVETNEVYTNFTQGALKQTENDFDVALEGDGLPHRADAAGGAAHAQRRLPRQQRRLPRHQVRATSCWGRTGPSS